MFFGLNSPFYIFIRDSASCPTIVRMLRLYPTTMFLAVHAAVGAIAGNAVDNPIAALSLGLISHFFTDMVPHGDEVMYEGYKSGEKVVRGLLYVSADAVATIILIACIFLKQDFFSTVNVALGIIGGILPDLLVGLAEATNPKGIRRVGRILNQFRRFHIRNHHLFIGHFRKGERDIPLRYGLMLQAISLGLLLRVIF